MHRRKFLEKSLIGAAGAGLVAACGKATSEDGAPAVHTNPSITWRLASSFPRGLDTIFGSAEVLARRLEAMSDGKFRLRVYPLGEIVPGLQVMDAVQQGTVQVGHTASYYYIGKNPALAFDSCVPFGMTSRQQTAWLTEGGGLDLMRGLFADFGMTTFPAGNTGSQMGGWFKREIGSASDLQGLKMRIPGLGGEVMSRLGVTVQVLAGGDIYPALERGAIDATEWVAPYNDLAFGFHEVTRYYYYPGWHEPGSTLELIVNKQAFEALPEDLQAIVEIAARYANADMLDEYTARNNNALQELVEQHDVQLRKLPDDVIRALHKTSDDYLAELAQTDELTQRVYNSWKQFLEGAKNYHHISEQAYINARDL